MRTRIALGWLVAALVATLAGTARADDVVLKNGDRLRGDVRTQGSDYVVKHEALGEVTVPGDQVERIVIGTSGCTEASGCTRCPVPAEEAKSATERPWTFWIGVGLTNDSGNTEKIQFNLDTEASYRWRKNRLRGRFNWFYEESNGEQTEGKLFANVVYERSISPRGKLFGMWLIDRDDFADILYRTGWFVGYGYDFIQREKTTLTGKIGAGAVVESRKDVPVLRTAAFLAQMTYEHEFRWGDSFRANAYVIPYVDYVERSPWRLELRYAHPLRNHLDLTAGFLLDWVDQPPEGIKSYDTKITFGIRWRP